MKKRILIAEHEIDSIQYLNRELTNFGYFVKIITEAGLLIKTLEKELFDLILINIDLPITDGITALQKIKTHPVFYNIPIIMIMDKADDNIVESLFMFGADDFLIKPFENVLLKLRIKSAFDKQIYIKKIRSNYDKLKMQGKYEKENKERIKKILESINTCIVLIDPVTRKIVNSNTSAIKMFGNNINRICNDSCLYKSDKVNKKKCPVFELDAPFYNKEIILRNSEDKNIHVLKTAVLIKMKDKELILESFINISLLKEKEIKLKQQKKKLEIQNKEFSTLNRKIKIQNEEREKIQATLQKAYEDMELKVNERTSELVQINKLLNKEIAERKETSKSLRKSESSLSKAQEIACLGSWEFDFKKKTLIWSDQMYKIFGLQKDFKVNFESMVSLIHFDDEEHFMQAFRAFMSDNEVFEIQYRVVRQDKSERFVHTQAEKVFNENSVLINIHGITHDITDIKITENELLKSNRKFSFFFNETPLAYIEWNTELEVVDWNPSSERIFGYTRQEVLGISILDYIVPVNLQIQIVEIWIKLMKQITGQISTYVNLTKDNKRIVCNWFNTPLLDKKNEIIGMASLIQDITDLKIVEKELKQARIIAEKANIAKSEFLANLSHEIRTPMNSILGFSEILSNQINDPIHKNYLDSIRSSSKTLLSLINDILDLSKIESGKVEIKKTPVNIRLIISELESIFGMKLKEKQLNFVKEISPNLPQFLNLDELRMRQVLLNLISNAVKFTDSGYIKIKVKIHKKYADKIDLYISVTDTGTGISKENQKIIFDSFQQVEEQDTRKFSGTGLGLSISKQLVELMGGKISVKSKLNEGSIFSIIIKGVSIIRHDIEQEDKFELNPEKIEFEHSQILIVDDIENNRNVIKGFLSKYNFDILEAENGQQALYILKEKKADIIFMDIKMPVMDGHQLLKAIRKDKKLKDITIIAVTALAFENGEKDMVRKGFDGYLLKPVTQIEILNELTKYIKYKEKIVKEETENFEEIVISKEDLEKFPVFFEKIEREIIPIWNSVSKKQTMQKTKRFYDKLKQLNDLFYYEPIRFYCHNLSNSINSFNVDEITELILLFPHLINKLKNKINKTP